MFPVLLGPVVQTKWNHEIVLIGQHKASMQARLPHLILQALGDSLSAKQRDGQTFVVAVYIRCSPGSLSPSSPSLQALACSQQPGSVRSHNPCSVSLGHQESATIPETVSTAGRQPAFDVGVNQMSRALQRKR